MEVPPTKVQPSFFGTLLDFKNGDAWWLTLGGMFGVLYPHLTGRNYAYITWVIFCCTAVVVAAFFYQRMLQASFDQKTAEAAKEKRRRCYYPAGLIGVFAVMGATALIKLI